MNYSLTQGGIIAMIVGAFLVQWGFSDSCSNELVSKLLPVLGLIPGAVTAWIGRVRAGGVKWSGFRKDY